MNLRLEQRNYASGQEIYELDRAWDKWDQGGKKRQEPVLNRAFSKGFWLAVEKDANKILKSFRQINMQMLIILGKALAYEMQEIKA